MQIEKKLGTCCLEKPWTGCKHIMIDEGMYLLGSRLFCAHALSRTKCLALAHGTVVRSPL